MMRINKSVRMVITSVFAVGVVAGCSSVPEPQPLCEDIISEIQISTGNFTEVLAGWGAGNEAAAEKLLTLSAEVENLDTKVNDQEVLKLLEDHAKSITDVAAMVAATPLAPTFEEAKSLALLMETYETSKIAIIKRCSASP